MDAPSGHMEGGGRNRDAGHRRREHPETARLHRHDGFHTAVTPASDEPGPRDLMRSWCSPIGTREEPRTGSLGLTGRVTLRERVGRLRTWVRTPGFGEGSR